MVGVTSIVRVRVVVIWVTLGFRITVLEVGALDVDFWAGFPGRGGGKCPIFYHHGRGKACMRGRPTRYVGR